VRSPTRKASLLLPNAFRRIPPALLALPFVWGAFGGAVTAQEPETAEWSQFQGGAGHPGLLSDGPAPPYRIRWTLPAPEGEGLSGAVIVDRTAIALGEGAVYGVDLATGKVAWEVPRAGGPLSVPAVVAGDPPTLLFLDGPEEEAGASPSPGETPSPTQTPSPSPALDVEEAGSALVAMDLSSREERWRAPLAAVSRTGVTVDGQAAYVGDEDGMVYAIATTDGEVLWSRELGESRAEGDAAGCLRASGARIDVPIAVADGRVVVVGRNVDGRSVAVSAFDVADGSCLWRKSPQVGSSAVSAPATAGDAVVIGFADRLARSLDAGDGEQRWAELVVSLFSPVTSPALQTDAAYLADLGGGLYRLDPGEGSRVWSYQFNESVRRSSPVVSGETVLLGLFDGRLVAVDAASGVLVWQSEATPGQVGTISLSREVVVAVKGGRDAGLIAFEHDPDGSLVRIESPTVLEPGTTLSRIGTAAAIVLAALLLPGMLARRRWGGGPVEESADEEIATEEEEPA
jgi:outer membrane protein assembly factor BamB